MLRNSLRQTLIWIIRYATCIFNLLSHTLSSKINIFIGHPSDENETREVWIFPDLSNLVKMLLTICVQIQLLEHDKELLVQKVSLLQHEMREKAEQSDTKYHSLLGKCVRVSLWQWLWWWLWVSVWECLCELEWVCDGDCVTVSVCDCECVRVQWLCERHNSLDLHWVYILCNETFSWTVSTRIMIIIIYRRAPVSEDHRGGKITES